MTSETADFNFTMRPGRYHRKSDGKTVVAGDWPDGSVSWMLEPLPIVLVGSRAVGTCSFETFERTHVLAKAEGHQHD